MLENGFIKLHRSLLGWEWYDDSNTLRLFLHLILTVNYEDNYWHGILVCRGQRITSVNKLAVELKLSDRNIRTALKHLISTNEVTSVTSAQNSIITVLNYDKYQSVTNEPTSDRQTSDEPLTSDRQATDNKGRKNNKANNEKEDINADIFFDYEFSTVLETTITDWIKYKQEKRQSYKPTGLKQLLTQIQNKTVELGEPVVLLAISESMACNYQGIIWDKGKANGQQKTQSTSWNLDIDYDKVELL